MTQPPGKQPPPSEPQRPDGAAEQAPPGGAPPSPGGPEGAQPAAPPQAPAAGPSPYAQPQAAPPPAYGCPGAQPGPYAQPFPQQGAQPGPYAPPGPYQPGAQPGGYGQPGPNPYAQQPGAAPYGGYGAPQQQYPGGPGMPPPPPYGPGPGAGGGTGGPGFFRSRAGIVLAAVVAGVVVVGGGSWLAFGTGGGGTKPVADVSPSPATRGPSASGTPFQGDGKGPGGPDTSADPNAGRKAGEARVLWTQAAGADVPRDHNTVYGPWFVGNTVVRALYKQVAGYAPATGKQLWSVTLPQSVCAAPVAPTADGRIVVAYEDGTGESAHCDQIEEIDLRTGKAGWHKTVAQQGQFDILLDLNMAIVGDTVAVSRIGGTNAYRVGDGKPLFSKVPGECQPVAVTSGNRMIADESCPGSGLTGHGPQQLQELDPVTGKPKWTFRLKSGYALDKVYSTDPLVVSVKNDDTKAWAIASFGADGTQRATMRSSEKFSDDCGDGLGIDDGTLQDCKGVAVDAHTLYITTALDESHSPYRNAVVAFDLATGKQKWKAPAPSGRLVDPVAPRPGGGLLVYEEATPGQAGALASLGSGGGAYTVVRKHPDAAADLESSGFYHPSYHYVGGRFYLTNYAVMPPARQGSDTASLSMMVLGD
ncbi:PQQ-binding-like beta-propeller repeat protein [Streptomyces sp. NPDC047002]|uniref:outer membrane protein assembly factor BamB family protein n=1 Tax=Streptomyces sp. NPDC047002 TaxID=3155475 RepID=UPI003454786A